eukprot:870496-Rhodomonas_salina.4
MLTASATRSTNKPLKRRLCPRHTRSCERRRTLAQLREQHAWSCITCHRASLPRPDPERQTEPRKAAVWAAYAPETSSRP